jgi:hypothetical protein
MAPAGNLGVELRPKRRIQLLSWTLLVFFAACMLACVIAWGVLLTMICDNPRTPVPRTQHVIPYSCHGMTVFMSPLQDALRTWLTPLGLLFMFLGLLAGVMVVLSYAKVRIDVHVDVTDGKTPPPAGR